MQGPETILEAFRLGRMTVVSKPDGRGEGGSAELLLEMSCGDQWQGPSRRKKHDMSSLYPISRNATEEGFRMGVEIRSSIHNVGGRDGHHPAHLEAIHESIKPGKTRDGVLG